MSHVERPLFTFSAGARRSEEYNAFIGLLERTLRLEGPVAVVLALGEFPSAELLSSLQCREWDSSLDQWVLTYEGRAGLVRDLWLLLLGAEPEFVFQFNGSLPALLQSLQETYFQPYRELRALRQQYSPLRRILRPHTLPHLPLAESRFAEVFAPIVHHMGGGIFTLVERHQESRAP